MLVSDRRPACKEDGPCLGDVDAVFSPGVLEGFGVGDSGEEDDLIFVMFTSRLRRSEPLLLPLSMLHWLTLAAALGPLANDAGVVGEDVCLVDRRTSLLRKLPLRLLSCTMFASKVSSPISILVISSCDL